MERRLLFVGLMTLLAGGACGGGGGDALISSTLTGQFQGQSFTPNSGVATVYQGSDMIAVGNGPLTCSSAQQNDPPMGITVTFSVPSFAVGTYSTVFVDFVRYEAQSFDGFGSSDATVTLSAVDAMSVTGTIAYSYTDTSTGDSYALSGDFDVSRCPM